MDALEGSPSGTTKAVISAGLRRRASISELAGIYEVSRKTIYKWLDRHDEQGVAGLADASRRPHESPNQVSAEVEAAIVAARHRWKWGPRKLRVKLCQQDETRLWPSISTIATVLKNKGLIVKPGVIHTDNGVPFASVAPGGLNRLPMWFVRLGITPERSRPGSPQDNGRHERMHRTLKQATAAPPHATVRLQQKAFDAFRHEFNQHRPHQALGDLTPAACYRTGTRRYPWRVPELHYADDVQVRRALTTGQYPVERRADLH